MKFPILLTTLCALASVSIAASQPLDLASATDATGRPPCGPNDPAREWARQQRLDPATEVTISLGQARLEIPWAYTMPRVATTRIGCENDWDRFGFQFWVPSLKPPEDDQRFSGTYRPAERRADRASDDTVIKVIEVTSYNLVDFPEGSPTERRIETLKRTGVMTEMPALSKAQIAEMAARNDESIHWWWLTTPDGSIIIRCYALGPQPACRGQLSARQLRMDILFDFPMDALWRHEEMARGMMTLLERWRR